MDKEKWKKNLEILKERIGVLKLSQEEDSEDFLQMEETPLSSGETLQNVPPEDDLEAKLARNRRNRLLSRIAIVAVIVCVILGFYLYNQLHTFKDYVIASSAENLVSSGTQYEVAGNYIYRYNSDGVTCVTRNNEVQWSITYNVQAPIVDVCGTTMVIAEQQGTQIYVVNEDGLMGNFEALLPILKVRVSNQGVVAAVLQDDDVTWVNLYQTDGDVIVSDKTTVTETGYPLDVDVSPNGENMVVSYLGIIEGVMQSDVVFYNFGSVGQAATNYIVNSETYSGTLVPQVYFVDNSTAVAVADEGFVVFKGSSVPEVSAEVWFNDEIVSSFHDDGQIGFLFSDSSGEYTYQMELYNYRGRKKASWGLEAVFDEIKIQNGQIILYNSSSCSVYTSGGRLRFASSYEKEIVEIFYFSEYRKYLIITQDSFDYIRIC